MASIGDVKEDGIMAYSEEQVMELLQIDQEMGVSYCADSRDVYIEMLQIYVEQGEENLAKLPEMVMSGDWKNYAVSVHGLKSTSLTIGAVAFSAKAKEQELAAKAEEIDFIKGTYEEFLQVYRKVLAAVQTVIDEG